MSRCPAAALLLLVVIGSGVLSSLTGCQLPSLLITAVQNGQPIAPLYELPKRDTVVVVDDPTRKLGPAATRQIATTAVHHLTFKKVLGKKNTFVSPKQVAALESQVGPAWPQLPIDEVARRLGAEQVIYVKITSLQTHVAGSVFRPKMTLEVKVIEAEGAKRLWPEPGPIVDPQNPAPGHELVIDLKYQSRNDQYEGDSTPDDIARRLADEAGLMTARLFYKWKKPPPGDTL